MGNIEHALDMAANIKGVFAVAVVDYDSGMTLGSRGGSPEFDLDVAAPGNSDVVRTTLEVMAKLGLRESIEDILITLGTAGAGSAGAGVLPQPRRPPMTSPTGRRRSVTWSPSGTTALAVIAPLAAVCRVEVAVLVDVASGMTLDAWVGGHDEGDPEVLGAAHADVVRALIATGAPADDFVLHQGDRGAGVRARRHRAGLGGHPGAPAR